MGRPASNSRVHDTVHGAGTPVPLATDLREGTTLAGYRLDEVVGRGGMGVVYRAYQALLDRTVALKLLSPDAAADEQFRQRFLRESRVAASLEHPHVVPVYDAGEEDGLLYIAMRYVQGTDLGKMLARAGALEPSRAIAIAEQVGSALDAAHERSLVHRDVKPGNVLLDGRHAYLGDFGLTKRVSSDTRLTAHGDVVGTIDYMPPEQIEGGRLDARSDVYAFACVLHHMLTGAPPFQRDSAVSVMHAQLHEQPPPISQRRGTLPAALDPIFERGLAKRRDERYGRCLELVAGCRAALGMGAAAQSPQTARAPSTTVLVAARDARLRAAVRGMLGSERFSFREAETSDEVLDETSAAPPEIVLLDWSLTSEPLALCRELRAAAGAAGTKIVIVSARSEAPSEATRSAAGVDSLVVWPSSALQLQVRIGELLPEGGSEQSD